MKPEQEQSNQDTSNQELTQEANGEETTSLEEWKRRTERAMEILGGERDFSRAGKTFVMPDIFLYFLRIMFINGKWNST